MAIQGVMKDKRTIALQEDTTLAVGTEVLVEVKPVAAAEEEQELPMPSPEARAKWRALIGAFDSGLTDVSQHKHTYLADAYEKRPQKEPPGA
jgi:hypothetical protein